MSFLSTIKHTNQQITNFVRSKYKNYILSSLCVFNAIILFLNVLLYKSGIAISLLFIDSIFLLFLSEKDTFRLILFLLPFTFVFKDPHFSTSFVSIFLLEFYIKTVVIYLKKPQKLSASFFGGCVLLLVLSLFGIAISLFNISISYMRMLPSYFLYLSLPLVLSLLKTQSGDSLFKSGDYCVWLLFGTFLSTLVSVPFFYLFSNGESLLKRFTGVSFAKGNDAGSIYRFSALNPDPNYSTILLLIPIFILLFADMPKKEKIVGSVFAAISLIINLLSLSKMYYLCLAVLLVTILIKIYIKAKSKMVLILFVLSIFAAVFFMLTTPSGVALFNRFFSSESSSFIKHLTSNRSELFGDYCRYVLYNPLRLFFGVGPTAVDRELFTNETHNAFIGTLYQNGLIGTVLIICYYYLSTTSIFCKERIEPISFIGFILCFILVMSALNMETSVFTPVVFSVFAWTKKQLYLKKGAVLLENNCTISI